MSATRILPLALALAAGCGGGVGSYDDAADEALKAMRELETILDSVTNTSSAEAAKPRLEALAKRMGEIVEATRKLGEPSADVMSRIDGRMAKGMEGVGAASQAYLERIMEAPEIGSTLEEPWAAVNSKLMQLRGMLGG